MKSKNWFEVDRRGLAKLMSRRGKGVAVLELIQNAFDEPITSCTVTVEPHPKLGALTRIAAKMLMLTREGAL